MSQKHVILLSMVSDFFKNDMVHLKRGENAYSSGHVTTMLFDSSIQPGLLKGTVQASMRNKLYNVEFSVDSEDGFIEGQCSCPRGQAICHHMAALAIHAHHNVSITDQACAWNAPKAIENENIKTMKELYPPTKAYNACTRPLLPQEIHEFRNKLEQSNVVGFTWILKPCSVDQVLKSIPSIEDILFSEDFLNSSSKEEYFTRKCELTEEVKNNIIKSTIGQVSNENWLIARKNRLTASTFGLVLKAHNRRKYPPSLFTSLTEGYNLNGVMAVQWGREHESAAIKAFEAATNLKVVQTGLWLDKCGYIGASPDGLIGDNGLVEIKCPYKYRNQSLVEGLQKDKNYIVFTDENGQRVINTNHVYYHQIQGQLHLTQREMCYLVLWTPAECVITEIEREAAWGTNIDILKTFYKKQFIPYICGTKL